MFNYIRRRKRLFMAAAAGVAGAAAAYYWLCDDGQADRQPAESSLQGDGHPASQDNVDDESGLDASMGEHFEYIQGVSTPQELEQLLPRVRAALNEMTDVQAALSALPPGAAAASKLHTLAQHSLGRALGGVWVLPLLDLLVRTKLNIIGRHLLLQEKLSKLRQPQVQLQAGRGAHARAVFQHTELGPSLPPRIQASAIQAFLPCEFFAASGSRWLVTQVLGVIGKCLEEVSLEAERGPRELLTLLLHLHAHVRGALDLNAPAWVQLTLGTPALAYGPPQQAGVTPLPGGPVPPPGMPLPDDPLVAQMVQELQAELFAAVSSSQWNDAVQAAVQLTFRDLCKHVLAGFPGTAEAHPGTQPGNASAQRPDANEAVARQGSSEITSAEDVQEAQQRRTWGAWLGQGLRAMQSSVNALFVLEPQPAASAVAGGGPEAREGQHAGSGQQEGGQGQPPLPYDLSVHAASVHKPARPTARLLRPVQSASDPLFADAVALSKAISGLGPVLSLSAATFALPITCTPHPPPPAMAPLF